MKTLAEPIVYRTFVNPFGDRALDEVKKLKNGLATFLALEAEARARSKRKRPNFLDDDRIPGTSVGEHLLRKYPLSKFRVKALDKWYRATMTYIPPPIFNWWDRQFALNPVNLDRMSQPWWRERIRTFSAALIGGDIWRPVGGMSSTIVYQNERKIFVNRIHVPVYYEGRGLVVAEGYHGQGIGTQLNLENVRAVRALKLKLPMFAATQNPVARKIFLESGATDKPTSPDFPYAGYNNVYNQIACWDYPVPRDKELCAACPMIPGNCWWWRTHTDLPK